MPRAPKKAAAVQTAPPGNPSAAGLPQSSPATTTDLSPPVVAPIVGAAAAAVAPPPPSAPVTTSARAPRRWCKKPGSKHLYPMTPALEVRCYPEKGLFHNAERGERPAKPADMVECDENGNAL